MTFTNENGEKFELDELLTVTNPKDRIVIRPIEQKLDRDIRTVLNNYPREYVEDYLKDRPIKPEPKYTVELSEGRQEVNIYLNGLDPTKYQAQLIKEAVGALMQNITGHVKTEDDMWLHAHIDSARAAFQKEQT